MSDSVVGLSCGISSFAGVINWVLDEGEKKRVPEM